MKNWMRLTLVLILVFVFAGGCITGRAVKDKIDCEDSIIYAKIGNPETIGTLIQIANLKAIEDKKYKKKQAIETIGILKSLLTDGTVTFSSFLDDLKPVIGKHIAEYGTELILLDVALTNLYVDNPIPKCDRDLLLSLCDKMLLQLR